MSINQAPVLTTGDANGIVRLDLGSLTALAPNVVLQADGKIVVNVNAPGPGHSSELARYNADGSLDTTFGTDGVISSAPGSATGAGVAVQADGKVVVAGRDVVARYNSDGSLDASFGTGGKTALQSAASTLTMDADGKIVVAGGIDLGFTVARYDSSGHLDSSFGVGGQVTTSFGSSVFVDANSVISQPDGKVVVAGDIEDSGKYDFALARYNNDGSLDTSFGTGGKVTTDFASTDNIVYSVTLQADGKIVAAGFSNDAFTTGDFALARYNTDGSLDASFGTGGKVTTNLGNHFQESAESVRIQPDGKILIAGYSYVGPGAKSDFALLRYNSDGSLDSSFGTGGKVVTNLGPQIEEADSLVIQPDGKILVVGTMGPSGANPGSDLALARYNSDGSLDTSFGADTGAALSGPTFFTENAAPTVLNARATVHDAELAAAGSYAGASLTLARHGGADAQDVFGASGNLATLAQGGDVVLSGVAIGTVTQNAGGMLVLTFGAAATEARVNEAMRDITYANTSDTPSLSAQIDWSFSDGNSGAQGSGGALAATGLSTVHVTAFNDPPVNTMPSPLSVFAGADYAVAGLSVSDPDSASLTAVLRVDHGTLKIAPVNGLVVVGSGTSSVALFGSVAQIDATLGAPNNLLYRSTGGYSGADTLSMQTVDSAGDPGANVVSSVAINVTPKQYDLSAQLSAAYNHGGGEAVASLVRAIEDISGTFANLQVDSDGSANGANWTTIAQIDGYHSHDILNVILDSSLPDGSVISVAESPGSVSINDVVISEGDSGTKTAAFTVTRSGGTTAFAIDFATSDGSATTADNDYVAASGTLNFAAGVNTQTISVTIDGDSTFESNEAFSINLSGATNGAAISDGSGTGTITNDDAEPAGSVSINDVTVSEGDSGSKVATFTVTRSGGAAAFDVHFATADGSATAADNDYLASAGTLHFAHGDATQTISVAILGDRGLEADEAFSVNLSNATNGATIGDGSGTGTITNDDLEPVGTVSINDVTISEGNSGSKVATFTVTRSGGTAAFDVNFATSDGSARIADHDYVANAGTLHFGAGDTTQTISVTINGDTQLESSETFFVDLSGATNDAGVIHGHAIGTIADDDAAFASVTFPLATFGPGAGGWTDQTHYPREVADVNGDHMADIVGFGADGVIVSLATGNGHFGALTTGIDNFGSSAAGGGWTSDNQYPRQLADVNGDHLADIVGFGADGVIVSLATGNGHFASPVAGIQNFGFLANGGGWTSENQYPRQLADVNGDGMADIVGFGADGAIVSLATGNGHFAAPVAGIQNFGFLANGGGWTSQDQYPRLLADVNGDHMADIVGFGADGVIVSLATGSGHFASPVAGIQNFGFLANGGGWTSENQYPRQLADVNGDGMADIVGFSADGAIVSFATGNGHFASPVAGIQNFGFLANGGGWTSQDQYPRELADVNGDGAADIIGFGHDGVFAALSNGFHLI